MTRTYKKKSYAGEPPKTTARCKCPKRVSGPCTGCRTPETTQHPREQDTNPEHMAAPPGKQPEPGESEKERGGVEPSKNINGPPEGNHKHTAEEAGTVSHRRQESHTKYQGRHNKKRDPAQKKRREGHCHRQMAARTGTRNPKASRQRRTPWKGEPCARHGPI
ncbi:hypothetical protein NDU88_003372 [Pleurodeles waltl]|uniref:Uncharacterized protein n=1 Tax=Pleurodeles waltl TaxID=8319 RepID=A0AAV7M365_PLEWA|nr:hypothetical protein NDU88_003372 [Pleurodeles waltl]